MARWRPATSPRGSPSAGRRSAAICAFCGRPVSSGPGPTDGGGCTRWTRPPCGSWTTGWRPTAGSGRSGSTRWTPRWPAAGGRERVEDRHDRRRGRKTRDRHPRARRAAAAGVRAVVARPRRRRLVGCDRPRALGAVDRSLRGRTGARGYRDVHDDARAGALPPADADRRVRPAAAAGRRGRGLAARGRPVPVGVGAWLLGVGWPEEGERPVLRSRRRFAPEADVADYAMGWHWSLDKLSAA